MGGFEETIRVVFCFSVSLSLRLSTVWHCPVNPLMRLDADDHLTDLRQRFELQLAIADLPRHTATAITSSHMAHRTQTKPSQTAARDSSKLDFQTGHLGTHPLSCMFLILSWTELSWPDKALPEDCSVRNGAAVRRGFFADIRLLLSEPWTSEPAVAPFGLGTHLVAIFVSSHLRTTSHRRRESSFVLVTRHWH